MKDKYFIKTIVLLYCMLLIACSSKQKSDTSYLNASDYDIPILDETEETVQEYAKTDNSIKIPYTEMYGNTITIPVKINGMSLDMIYDTGASSTMITLAEAKYLYGKGTLTQDDILDKQRFQTADGGIVEGLRINLRKVSIGDKITLYNIEAAVVENQHAPLLLGQSVMKNFREISVDRENKVVKFFE